MMGNQCAFSNIVKIPEFHYLCNRNVERVALEGIGVSSAILLTQSGFFIKDSSFFQDGSIFVDFFRDTFISLVSKFIKPPCFGLDWDIIRESIINGCPVIILVDVYFMPYKVHFHKNHAAHCVLLSETRNNEFLVIDWYEPDYYIGYVEEHILDLARQSSNEKDGASVYSGYPIKAMYKIVDGKKIDGFNYDKQECIRINLQNMYKRLLSTETKNFIIKIRNSIPEWIQNYNNQYYLNAVKSFFFLELELNIFIYYLNEVIKIYPKSNEYVQIEELTNQLKTSVLIIKNKLHRSIRRQNVLDINSWMNYCKVMAEYYDKLLDLLSKIGPGERS